MLADEFELCEVERVEFQLEVFLVSEAVGLAFERVYNTDVDISVSS